MHNIPEFKVSDLVDRRVKLGISQLELANTLYIELERIQEFEKSNLEVSQINRLSNLYNSFLGYIEKRLPN